ncbi:hypothetical protein NFJ02_05g121030 [Pycnococcus provasolii]
MPLFLVGWQHAPSTVTLIRANHPKHLAKIIMSCGFDANTCVWTEYQGPLFLNFNAHARRIHVQPTHNTDADEEGNVPPNTTSVMKEGADGLFRPIPGSIPAEEFPASPGADGGRLAQSLRGKVEQTRSATFDELALRLRTMQLRMEMDVSAKAGSIKRRTAAKQLLFDAREEQKMLEKQRARNTSAGRVTFASPAKSVGTVDMTRVDDDEEAEIRRTFEELRGERARLQTELRDKQHAVELSRERKLALDTMQSTRESVSRGSLGEMSVGSGSVVPLRWTIGRESAGTPGSLAAPEERAAFYEIRRAQILDQQRAIEMAAVAARSGLGGGAMAWEALSPDKSDAAASNYGYPAQSPSPPPPPLFRGPEGEKAAWEAAVRSLPSEAKRAAAESANLKPLAERSANELIAWAEAKRAEATILREARTRDAEARRAQLQMHKDDLEGRRVQAHRRRKLVEARREQAVLEEEVRSYLDKCIEHGVSDGPIPRTLQDQQAQDAMTFYKTPRTAQAEEVLHAARDAAVAAESAKKDMLAARAEVEALSPTKEGGGAEDEDGALVPVAAEGAVARAATANEDGALAPVDDVGAATTSAENEDGALAPVDDVAAATTSAADTDGALVPADDAPAPEAPPPAALEEAVEEEKGAAKPSIDPAGAEDLLDAELENELLAGV